MFVVGQFFSSLALLCSLIFSILYFLLAIQIILSWFQVSPYSEVVQVIYRITEPILKPFRKLPLQMGMIDFSPMVAFIILYVLRNFIVGVLTQLAGKFTP